MFEMMFLLMAAAPDAEAILRRSTRVVLGEQAVYTVRMAVAHPGRAERVVEMKGWKKGDRLGLVRYTAPAKERGTAYLRNGDSNWLFLPAAEKVVRVGPKQNFGGGDFSNADILRPALFEDYLPTVAGEETVEGVACHRLELKARNRSVAYDRVVCWVRSDGSFFPVRSEYYTVSGKKMKWLLLTDVAVLGGRRRPTRLAMESALDPGARTELRFLTIDENVELDERLFTPAALEAGD